MAGIMRWRDLQNIFVTEDQINLLAGLIVNASLLNSLDGFTGTGTGLNAAIDSVQTLNTHISKELHRAHTLVPNSIDGGILVNGTVSKSKLAFNALTDQDYLTINNLIAGLSGDHNQLVQQVQNLYSVLFPSVTGDIAQQFDQLIGHIEQLEDAHDASAISVGNQYPITTSLVAGAIQTTVSPLFIKYFKTGDVVEFRDTNSGPETRTLVGVNYNGNQIGWSQPLIQDYNLSNSATVKNISHANAQQALDRSLKNSTDVLTGRLTIVQSTGDDALAINKTGPGYTASFNTFVGKTSADFSLELGNNNGNSSWSVRNSDKRIAANITDQGNAWFNNVELEDRATLNHGHITKQTLSAERTWTLPDRSGFIGLGDLSFTELLKVSLVPATKQLTIAPGFKTDYTGQKVGAWITMDKPSSYPGSTIDIQAKFISDNQALSLGSKWQVFVVYINDNDILNFFYGPQKDTKADAISEYRNFIPSAFMKLAMLVIHGDGLGGIIQSSIEILEDQRPFFTMGMSASYYEEVIETPSGFAAGALITLPANSRAGGMIQTYKPGRGQLEVYIDGLYQDVAKDYEETQGEPIGRIRVLKDIPANSKIKFRITYAAAAVTGGFEVPTLQSAYMAGPLISINDINGPVKFTSFDADLLLDIDGSINITNKIYNLKNLLFQTSTLLTDLDKNQLFVNSDAELIYHQYKNNTGFDYNILQEIDGAKTLSRMNMFNGAGIVIPKGRGVALHPSLPNAIVLCDTSSSLSLSRCIGVALENIAVGAYGDIITSGLFKLSGLGLAHNSTVVVDPRNPGKLVAKQSVNFLPTDEYMEVGIVDGGHLIVDLVYKPKVKTVWKIGIAGESFNANETVLVRFAIDGETRGQVFKADKANANLEQKFWVVAAVQPTVAVNIGDSVELFKDITLHASELAFSDEDMGKPLYLTSNGKFKPWRLLNGAFTTGDAAIKIGMIEDRRKFIVDGIQMMGTAPGPSFA